MSEVVAETNIRNRAPTPKVAPPAARWVFLFWLLLLVTNIQASLTFKLGDSGSLRWLHLVYPFAALCCIQDVKHIKKNIVFLFFTVSAIFNIIAYTRYGFSINRNFHFEVLLFSALFYFVGTTIARRMSYDVMLQNFRRFVALLFLITAIRNFFWVAGYGVDLYGIKILERNTFIVGGLNSEGMWFAALSMVFLDAAPLIPNIFILVISQIYNSRSTFVLWALGSLITLFRSGWKNVKRRGRHLVVPMIIGIMILCILLTIIVLSLDLPVLTRMAQFGGAKDSGTGRIIVWLSGLVLLRNNLFGYGIGNVMPRIYDMWSGISLLKPGLENTENLYIQIALEAGVISLAVYFVLILTVFLNYIRNRKFPQLFYIMVFYWIFENLGGGGGNDPMFWLTVGMYFTYQETEGQVAKLRKNAVSF